MSTSCFDREDDTFIVLVNHEDQYSIWPHWKAVPGGWSVVPDVRESDAFHEMKRRGVAYQRPERYADIVMPRNTGIGVFIGGFAFALGFAMVWHIWWLAIASGLGTLIAVAIRTFMIRPDP